MEETKNTVILTVNGGSSTVKCGLFSCEREPRLLSRDTLEGAGADAASRVVAWLEEHRRHMEVTAIGHRIVHGGPELAEPRRITPEMLETLRRLVPFAPNHLPQEIALIETVGEHLPGIPQVACFDTAFHQSMPAVARRLPIPSSYDARGVRRYGFHGLSYTYLVEELRRQAGFAVADGRVVFAHLGNGSSLAAVHRGRSVDTTMGFTPLGGVVMSSRSGDLDPGVMTHLLRTEGLSADELEEIVSQRSGLAAISGVNGGVKTLLERAAADPACQLALDIFVYSVAKAAAALAASLEGLETIVFAGGIGEHAAPVRAGICERLAFLGVRLDAARNQANAPVISSPSSRVGVRVIPTNEELIIAQAACRLLNEITHGT